MDKNHATKITDIAKKHAESHWLILLFPDIIRTLDMLIRYIDRLERERDALAHYIQQMEGDNVNE